MALQTLASDSRSRRLVERRRFETARDIVRSLWGTRAGRIGTVLVGAFVICALVSLLPVFSDAYNVQPQFQLQAPNFPHIFGTDEFGRDILARTFIGARLSLEMIVPACGIAMIVGTMLGIVAGYFGAFADNSVMRVVDMFFAFPPVLLALAIIAIMGSGMPQLMAAIAIVYTPMFVRVARGPVLELKEREYVKASRVAGAGPGRIIRSQIVGGIAAVVVVQLTLSLTWALLTETALSFLGLGLQPPAPDLGTMLSEGSQIVLLSPWLAIFPGVFILIAAMGFNLMGDGLRDALDPATRRSQMAVR